MTARNKQINKVDPEGNYQTLNNGDVTCEEWDLDTEFSFSVLCLLESLDLYNETALFSNKNLLFKLLPFYFDAISNPETSCKNSEGSRRRKRQTPFFFSSAFLSLSHIKRIFSLSLELMIPQ